ncbi:MAG: hypothetical protein EOP82_16055 [Variovorax sp.]|nr:MAG: hypothetical protein EOP82_16055 [Variovorax sp.]
MDTNRDKFHDWARDKPETTFSSLQALETPVRPSQDGMRWNWVAWLAVVGIALVVGFKFLVR